MSVAVIMLELNGHLSHSVPCMVCVLFSYAVAEWLKPESFFEMLANVSGLTEEHSKKGKIIVRDVLDQEPSYRNIDYISVADSNQEDMIRIV